MSGVRSWTGPALDRPSWTRSSEVQVQVHYISGPDMEVQVQVWQKCPGPGPDRTLDSLGLTQLVCTYTRLYREITHYN